MINLQTIVYHHNQRADLQRPSEPSQENRTIRPKNIEEKKPNATSSEIVLFHGGCIV
jgi:hypothetical protein